MPAPIAIFFQRSFVSVTVPGDHQLLLDPAPTSEQSVSCRFSGHALGYASNRRNVPFQRCLSESVGNDA
jgi:hypothetical protein